MRAHSRREAIGGLLPFDAPRYEAEVADDPALVDRHMGSRTAARLHRFGEADQELVDGVFAGHEVVNDIRRLQWPDRRNVGVVSVTSTSVADVTDNGVDYSGIRRRRGRLMSAARAGMACSGSSSSSTRRSKTSFMSTTRRSWSAAVVAAATAALVRNSVTD